MSPLSTPYGSPRSETPNMFRPSDLPLQSHGAHPCEAEDDSETISRSSSPTYSHPLARARSKASSVAASEYTISRHVPMKGSASEGTPLMGAENGQVVESGKWYEGPLFVAGVKLGILFVGFSALVLGTFWFGMPTVDE